MSCSQRNLRTGTTENYRQIIPEFNYFHNLKKKKKKQDKKYDLTFADGLVFNI